MTEVDPTEFGPAMLALTPMQRQFVVAWVSQTGTLDASACARAAGYSANGGADRVAGHRLRHDPRVIAAIREYAEPRLGGLSAIAIDGLQDIAADAEHRDRLRACTEILDRTGFPAQTKQTVEVKHEYDNRSTAELIAEIRPYVEKHFPDLIRTRRNGVIDVDFQEVTARIGTEETLTRAANGSERLKIAEDDGD